MELLPAQSQPAFYGNSTQMYTAWNLVAFNGHIPNLTSFANLPDLEITPVVNTATSASYSKCKSKAQQPEPYKKTDGKEQRDIENLLERLPTLNQNFKLYSKIGQGSFSTVYLATLKNSPTPKKFAVKHLTQDLDKVRIEREWKCMKEIGGRDNVVHAEYYIQNKDCVTFVMPYLPHTRFSDYVTEMTADETRLYMRNLFIALKRVHSFNVIHRDVKPGNFLYDRVHKRFLLVDFGLAQIVQHYSAEAKKKSTQLDENMPIDYSKKRKRKPSTSDDEKITPVKRNCRRIALKPKDSNQKVDDSVEETRLNETASNQDFKSPVKKILNKSSVEKTPLKSRTFSPASCPTSSRKKLFDEGVSNQENSKRDSNIGTSMLRAQLEMKMTSTSTDRSFTPLVANKSPTGSFVQVQNSRVVRQQVIPTSTVTVFQKPSPVRPSCYCTGKGTICSICTGRKKMQAPRAGTPGFRPPEVLLKYPYQTTAVDMWASGIILLCILSGCYPFFQSPSDLVALMEIMTIFGTEHVRKVADKFGRGIVCNNPKKGVDLKKLCILLRSRPKKNASKKTSQKDVKKCKDCNAPIKEDGCICLNDEKSETSVSNQKGSTSLFPDSAYHLLSRLLDLDPSTRITAAEALEHPFLTEM